MNVLLVFFLIATFICIQICEFASSYKGRFEKSYFQRLYEEVFEEVLPIEQENERPIRQFILVYMDQLRSIVRSSRLEDYLNPYQVATIKFWVDAGKLEITKCDPKHDEKLCERYKDHARRVLPGGVLNSTSEWRFKDLFYALREKQFKFCDHRLQQLISGTAQTAVEQLSSLNPFPRLDAPLVDAALILLPRLTRKSTCTPVKKCFPHHKIKKEKAHSIYTDLIINPCQRVAGSRELVKTLVDYIMRFKSMDMTSKQVQDWNMYADWCANFVRSDSKHTWTDVFNLMLDELGQSKTEYTH